jgi:hypothetical protein
MKYIFLIITAMFLVTMNCFSQVVLQKKASPVIQKNTSTKESAIKNGSGGSDKVNPDNASAALSDEYFSLNNETVKAANMHYSCILFDKNNRQIASFNDKGSQDEYSAGSEIAALKMQNGNAATFGDFSKGGRLHITIESKGNESWKISVLKLTLEFLNPSLTQNLSWKEIDLSTGKKEVDLFFNEATQDPIGKYDVRTNKKS